MSRRAPPDATVGTSPDQIEAQFYEALQRGNIELLMAVWADDDEVVCVHPGGPRMVGPAAIRAGFEAIFANTSVPVRPEQVHRLQWLGGALHHLVERIEVQTVEGPHVAWVLATNVYVKTVQGWRLVAHHASPGNPQDMAAAGTASAAPPAASTPNTLH
jgi:ketosteroid isomerase-like protein